MLVILMQFMTENGIVMFSKWETSNWQGVWGDRTNQEMWKSYKSPAVVAVIKRRRLEWLEHILVDRMDQTRGAKKIV
jgi:hypothetical protein